MRSSISERGVRGGLVLAAMILCGGRWRPDPEPVPEPEPELALPPPPALWGHPLPLPAEELPQGLANATSQGCAACHGELTELWAASAHAQGSSSWRAEAAANGDSPLCTSCHLPLQPQHATVVLEYVGGPIGEATTAPNPGYDSSLAGEGVTCVACHLREGTLVGPTGAQAPHPTVASEEASCATCHQFTWPGAEAPLYDTYGEWEESAWAASGVGCTDCHGAHELDAQPALSLLLDAPPTLTRGEPVQLSLTAQNTGAGHYMPTGSPWGSMVIEVQVLAEGAFVGEPWTATLGQTLSEEAPWSVTADTRLAPLEERLYEVDLVLPQSAPSGRGHVEVRTLRIGPDGSARRSQVTRVPVVVY